ncbi:exodeoxyribonuclease V subunit gamma, partial [Buchnera aphidicola (Hormaphis cornu)]
MLYFQKNFFFHEHEITLLEELIEQINIRWGLNNKHLSDVSIPCKEYNTWQYGLNKILLNYSLGPTTQIWNDIISYNQSNKLNSRLIGKLSGFIDLITKWRTKLKYPKKLQTWLNIIQDIFNEFFCKRDDIVNKKLRSIENAITSIIQDGIKNKYNKKIHINLLKTQIISKINQIPNIQQLFLGKIIFCNLTTLPGIPFKVTCILGLNDNVDKITKKLESFDLMHQYPDKK